MHSRPAYFICRFLTVCVGAMISIPVHAETGTIMTPEREVRWKAFLPKCHVQIQQRRPIHVVILGDSVGNFYTPDQETCYDVSKAWHRRFLEKLAARFYYTGGVRDLRGARRPKPAQAVPERKGPEITCENLCRDGAPLIQALQQLTTGAFDNDPELVILMYGTNDAMARVPVPLFKHCLESIVSLCKDRGVDLLLGTPPLICSSNPRESLSETRPYAVAVSEVAMKAGVLFVDTGKALSKVGKRNGPAADIEALSSYLDAVSARYRHGTTLDPLHPNAEGHDLMAKAAWERIWTTTPAAAFADSTASLVLPANAGEEGTFVLTLRDDPNKPERALACSPLWIEGTFEPLAPEPTLVRRFNAKMGFKFPVRIREGARPLAPADTITLSSVILDGATAELFDVSGPVAPVTIALPPRRIDGIDGSATVEIEVLNRLPAEWTGELVAGWAGKANVSRLEIPGRGARTAAVALPVPQSSQAVYNRQTIELELRGNPSSPRFCREIHFVKNLAAGETRALRTMKPGRPDLGGPLPAAPTVTPFVRDEALQFVVALPAMPVRKPDSQPPATVAFSIDGRAASKQGTFGFVDELIVNVPWEDGPIPLKKPRPAVFGNGYDRPMDPKFIKAEVSTGSDGLRVMQLSIPRVYFYLNEWGKGVSERFKLGVNVRVSLLTYTDAAPTGIFLPENSWDLSGNRFPRMDAQGLAVLESAAKTEQWSVTIY